MRRTRAPATTIDVTTHDPRLATHMILVPSAATIIELTGPGALQCLQGLVSNDLVKSGEDSLTYAGILTPKGLLITDCWIVRGAGRLFIVAPDGARAAVLDVLRRSLPPRLAKVADLTDTWGSAWIWTDGAERASGAELRGEVIVAGRANPTWFDRMAIGPGPALDAFLADARSAGAVLREAAWAERRRILAGWPRLGQEIDEKTLVQEVRFDENGGVSYEKGCYTGQETVARLHFRGHTNRNLRGLVWEGAAAGGDDRVLQGDREVGRVTSRLEMPERRVGLALLRREVDNGAQVVAGGSPATVVALPFEEAQRR